MIIILYFNKERNQLKSKIYSQSSGVLKRKSPKGMFYKKSMNFLLKLSNQISFLIFKK